MTIQWLVGMYWNKSYSTHTEPVRVQTTDTDATAINWNLAEILSACPSGHLSI